MKKLMISILIGILIIGCSSSITPKNDTVIENMAKPEIYIWESTHDISSILEPNEY